MLLIHKSLLRRGIAVQSSSISTHTERTEALQILNLTSKNVESLSARELRLAYLREAKKCHPDVSRNSESISHDDFLRVTKAYEVLSSSATTDEPILTASEEHSYRQACLDLLGQPAEIVEESKKCPNFREWLKGKTDAAAHWRLFFMLYGGLAPMSFPKALDSAERNVRRKKR